MLLNEEKNQIVDIFRKNGNGYLAQNDLQETITSFTYLFWNAKYNMNKKFEDKLSNEDICKLLKDSKEDKKFVLTVFYSIENFLNNANLINVCKFLNELSEEKVIDVICENYEVYSRYFSATPNSMIELVYKILETQKGNEVLDLCSYTGNFLTYYASKNKEYNYTGIEINSQSCILAEEKLKTQKVNSNIIENNVLGYEYEKKYNKIFCNQPLGLKLSQKDYDLINSVNKSLNTIFTKRITSDWGFVSSVLNAMDSNGKAVIVMCSMGLSKLPDQELRRELLEKGYVECVIELPGKLFSNTGVKTNLLVLSRENKKVKFIDASNLYEDNKVNNVLKVDEIFKEYNREEDSDITKNVLLDKIEENSYSLLVNDYMSKGKIEVKSPKILGDVAEIFRGYQIKSSEISQLSEKKEGLEPYKVINITDIQDGVINKNLTTIYPENNKMDRYLLKDKDLLISSKGTSNKIAVVKVENNEKFIASGNFFVLRFDTKVINPHYLKMFFESSKGGKVLNSVRNGAVLPSLNMSLFKNIEIPVPSIEEQDKAVTKYAEKDYEIKVIQKRLEMLIDSKQEIIDNEF